jgi:hypothetical protein
MSIASVRRLHLQYGGVISSASCQLSALALAISYQLADDGRPNVPRAGAPRGRAGATA